MGLEERGWMDGWDGDGCRCGGTSARARMSAEISAGQSVVLQMLLVAVNSITGKDTT